MWSLRRAVPVRAYTSPRTVTTPPPPRGRRTTEAAAWARVPALCVAGSTSPSRTRRITERLEGVVRKMGMYSAALLPGPCPPSVLPASFTPVRSVLSQPHSLFVTFFCSVLLAGPSPASFLPSSLHRARTARPCSVPAAVPSLPPAILILVFCLRSSPTHLTPAFFIPHYFINKSSLIFVPPYICSPHHILSSSAPIPVAARAAFFDFICPRCTCRVSPSSFSYFPPSSRCARSSILPVPPPIVVSAAAAPPSLQFILHLRRCPWRAGILSHSLAPSHPIPSHPIPSHPTINSPLSLFFCFSFSFHTHLSPLTPIPHVRHPSCHAPVAHPRSSSCPPKIEIGVDGVPRYRGEADEVLAADLGLGLGDLGSRLASVVKPDAKGARGGGMSSLKGVAGRAALHR
ncbi:hypothetical protein C8J57DRAFT_1563871 [Mycena rebaudengoi]|nr:hypothetical protein C8J57DRAFT_1563871 [Mycena rebaudengoi]